LLGICREEKGLAATAMSDMGLTIDALRAEIRRLGRSGPAETSGATETTTPARALPRDFRHIITAAYASAKQRGGETPDPADLLQAIIVSNSKVATAFASRKIDVKSLIDEIRRLPRQ
jgi:ATP-dependent Clp protease ATP-binding subunit ClpA